MAVLIDLWLCLLSTKLSYTKLFKQGHSNVLVQCTGPTKAPKKMGDLYQFIELRRFSFYHGQKCGVPLAPSAPRLQQPWCRAGSWSHFVGWWPLNEYTQHNRRTAAGCVPGEHYDTMLVFEKLAPLVVEPSCRLFVSKIGIG